MGEGRLHLSLQVQQIQRGGAARKHALDPGQDGADARGKRGAVKGGQAGLSAGAAVVATAAEEMTQTASLVVQNAEVAVGAASEANSSAKQGQQVIELSAGEMRKLVERMSSAVPIVEELAKNNANITDILGVIEGISEQRNWSS